MNNSIPIDDLRKFVRKELPPEERRSTFALLLQCTDPTLPSVLAALTREHEHEVADAALQQSPTGATQDELWHHLREAHRALVQEPITEAGVAAPPGTRPKSTRLAVTVDGGRVVVHAAVASTEIEAVLFRTTSDGTEHRLFDSVRLSRGLATNIATLSPGAGRETVWLFFVQNPTGPSLIAGRSFADLAAEARRKSIFGPHVEASAVRWLSEHDTPEADDRRRARASAPVAQAPAQAAEVDALKARDQGIVRHQAGLKDEVARLALDTMRVQPDWTWESVGFALGRTAAGVESAVRGAIKDSWATWPSGPEWAVGWSAIMLSGEPGVVVGLPPVPNGERRVMAAVVGFTPDESSGSSGAASGLAAWFLGADDPEDWEPFAVHHGVVLWWCPGLSMGWEPFAAVEVGAGARIYWRRRLS